MEIINSKLEILIILCLSYFHRCLFRRVVADQEITVLLKKQFRTLVLCGDAYPHTSSSMKDSYL